MQRAVYPIVPPIANAHMGGCPRLAATASDGPIQPSTTAAANAVCLSLRVTRRADGPSVQAISAILTLDGNAGGSRTRTATTQELAV